MKVYKPKMKVILTLTIFSTDHDLITYSATKYIKHLAKELDYEIKKVTTGKHIDASRPHYHIMFCMDTAHRIDASGNTIESKIYKTLNEKIHRIINMEYPSKEIADKFRDTERKISFIYEGQNKKFKKKTIVYNEQSRSTSNPSLFLDNDNNDVGCNDAVVPFDVDSLRVNTENIEVVRDIRFKLMNPVAASATNYGYINNQQNIPTVKDLSFWLPCPKKPVKYDESQTPTNWDYRTYVLLICHREGGTYEQSQGYWDVESNMLSRVQEY